MLFISPAASAAVPCDKPQFVWNPATTGGSDCEGRCGYFQTPAVALFVSRDATTFSWAARGNYRIESVVAKSARGRQYRAEPKENTVTANAGDRYVEVNVTVSNCHPPPTPKELAAARGEVPPSLPRLLVITASVLLALSAGAVGALWLRDRGILKF